MSQDVSLSSRGEGGAHPAEGVFFRADKLESDACASDVVFNKLAWWNLCCLVNNM